MKNWNLEELLVHTAEIETKGKKSGNATRIEDEDVTLMAYSLDGKYIATGKDDLKQMYI